jgi:hypothetical protein
LIGITAFLQVVARLFPTTQIHLARQPLAVKTLGENKHGMAFNNSRFVFSI